MEEGKEGQYKRRLGTQTQVRGEPTRKGGNPQDKLFFHVISGSGSGSGFDARSSPSVQWLTTSRYFDLRR